MGILDSLTGRNTPKKEFNLFSTVQYMDKKGVPAGIKEAYYEDQRLTMEKLESAYRKPLIYNSLNKTVQIILSADYDIEGDKKSIKYYENFFDMVGRRGGSQSWNKIKEKLFLYQAVYGFCPVENILNTDSDYIVDLDVIDPTTFGYAKNSKFPDKIALDEFGKPIGYTQNLLKYGMVVNNRLPIPEGVTISGSQIYLPRERVSLFKMNEIGDGFYGIGLIEPIYKTIQGHEAAEQGFINSCYRIGNPILEGIVGDENHEPTDEQIQNTANALKDTISKDVFAHGSWIKLNILEPKHMENMRTFLDYFIDMEITGMGLPMAFSTGSGAGVNRDTLARQEYMFKLATRNWVKKTCDTLNEILYRIAYLHNEKYPNNKINPCKIVWNEIALEELDAKAERLSKLTNAGLMTPTKEIEESILKSENLPLNGTPLSVTSNENSKNDTDEIKTNG